jgi:hypothetical protein
VAGDGGSSGGLGGSRGGGLWGPSAEPRIWQSETSGSEMSAVQHDCVYMGHSAASRLYLKVSPVMTVDRHAAPTPQGDSMKYEICIRKGALDLGPFDYGPTVLR